MFEELRRRVDFTLKEQKAKPLNKAARRAHQVAKRELAAKELAWALARKRTNKDRRADPPPPGKHRRH